MCCLHLHAQLGDQPLPGLRQQLRQRVRGDALHQRRADHDAHNPGQQHASRCRTSPCRSGSSSKPAAPARGPVDHHQDEAAAQQPAPRLHQLPYLGQDLLQRRPLFLGSQLGSQSPPLTRLGLSAECIPPPGTKPGVMCPVYAAILCGSVTASASRDEGPHAEDHIYTAKNRHRRLRFDRWRVRQRATVCLCDLDDCHRSRSEEAKQSSGDGNMHEDHPALVIGRGRRNSAKHKYQPEPGWDQRCRVDTSSTAEAAEAKQDERHSEADRYLQPFFVPPPCVRVLILSSTSAGVHSLLG